MVLDIFTIPVISTNCQTQFCRNGNSDFIQFTYIHTFWSCQHSKGFPNLHQNSSKLHPTDRKELIWRTGYWHISRVRCSVRWGGFCHTTPPPYTRAGRIFRVISDAPLFGAPTESVHGQGPGLLPHIFNGDPSAVWVRRGAQGGQGQGIPKITRRPRLLSWEGRRNVPGTSLFRGPVGPVTNSAHESVWNPGHLGICVWRNELACEWHGKHSQGIELHSLDLTSSSVY